MSSERLVWLKSGCFFVGAALVIGMIGIGPGMAVALAVLVRIVVPVLICWWPN